MTIGTFSGHWLTYPAAYTRHRSVSATANWSNLACESSNSTGCSWIGNSAVSRSWFNSFSMRAASSPAASGVWIAP